MNFFKIIPWIPIAILVIIGLILYAPAFLGFNPIIAYPDSLNFFLTVAITLFAAVEGHSTYMQVELSQNRNQIEAAKNELEKAYGPLYTILNKYPSSFMDKHGIHLNRFEENEINQIFAANPFMFSDEIYNLWQTWRFDIYRFEEERANVGLPLPEELHSIPLELKNKLNEEYDRKVKRYKKLLKIPNNTNLLEKSS